VIAGPIHPSATFGVATFKDARTAMGPSEQMQDWLIPIVVLCVAALLIWAWRIRASTAIQRPHRMDEKPTFETTMGELRDLREALRPVQKKRAPHPGN
jgi:hypothetical protein